MPRILHLIDRVDFDELQVALGPLLQMLPAAACGQAVAAIAGKRADFASILVSAVGRAPLRFGLPFSNAPAVRRLVDEQGIDLIHAWSIRAAACAALATPPRLPLALSVWDPQITPTQARSLLILRERPAFGALAANAVTQRRLIERGVPRERTAVVRPGVSFATINQARADAALRRSLGLTAEHTVMVLPGPPSVRGNQLHAVMIAEIVHRFVPGLVVLLPGCSAEQRKIMHYARLSSSTLPVIATESRCTPQQLLGIADILVMLPRGDVPTTLVAWAMASGVPLFGSAVYCIAEFIADGHNGHLVKLGQPMQAARKLLETLRSRVGNAAVYDRARAQAFECFGKRRYVDQVRQVHGNLLEGRSAGSELVDSAIDGA